MFVKERFVLNSETKEKILSQTPKFDFGFFGEVVFYRTYSRVKPNGKNESWNDVVIRVMEGLLSIRKDHYTKNYIHWDENFWQHYAVGMSQFMFDMKWMPPGRGLWALGTDFVYERGSMALNNCAFITMGDNLGEDANWIMDTLMHGTGTGFAPERNDDLQVKEPVSSVDYVIPDSREGWCESIEAQINSWLNGSPKPIFNYSLIRGPGEPIKGFGGISSGPDPLRWLHVAIDGFMHDYLNEIIDSVELKTNLANAIGYTVVAGNVRRSAELACGPITDQTFLDLKDYQKKPYRAKFGWLSNNSVMLKEDSDFGLMHEIAKRVVVNGEPGYINMQNLHKGRVGRDDGLRLDPAKGLNPCGEQPLESHELCTLVETCPTRCKDVPEWLRACEYATVYASTITLLLTHSRKTNAVMIRNRRIGVGLIDVANWVHAIGMNSLTAALRAGYKKIREINKWVNGEAGVPESIRVTTVKPGGTVPKVVGRCSGWNAPNFKYMIRRMNIADNSKLGDLLKEAGVPWEKSAYSMNTNSFEFPLEVWGNAKSSSETTIWEQAVMLIMLQHEWSDNAVSNTLTFRKSEIPDLEKVLSVLAPHTKSVALLPLQEADQTVYKQMPEEGISAIEYHRRLLAIKAIDWSRLNEESVPDAYCQGDKCELPVQV